MNDRSTKRVAGLLVLGVLALLIATNPTPDDFVNHMKGLAIEKAKARGQQLANFVSVVQESSHRKNYYLFSVYTTGIGDVPPRFIGVLGQFILLR